ncbi:hypothetical protein E9993_11950 [Labilibacter sediminis]|nr:hypothetical protein E9993_11950 [Labilibacter sediminis]
MYNLKYYITLFVLLLPVWAFGQGRFANDYYSRFKHITIKNGLTNNHVTCLLQDSKRYIWIGTRKGLVRYDGHELKTYVHHPHDSASIPSDYITCLLEDPLGNFWVGTKEGLVILDRRHQTFTQVPFLYTAGKGISHQYVRTIAQADSLHLWIETVDGNLHLMHSITYESKVYPHERLTQEYYDYHHILPDSKGTVWVGGRNFGPLAFTPQSENFSSIKTDRTDKKRKRDKDVACFFEDSNKQFWISATDGFYHYNRTSDVCTKKLATSTYDIKEDSNGFLWLATGGGLYRYHSSSESFTRFAHNESDELSLIHNHVNCVLIDDRENIWAGTQEGVSILLKRKNKIRLFRHIPSISSSLSHNEVQAFYQANDSVLYVGTDGGGLNKLDIPSEKFISYQTSRQPHSISSNSVNAIEGNKDNIWVGLWQGVGFNHFNPKTEKFSRYALLPDSRKRDWYNDLWFDGDHTLWCGVWGGLGIHLFNTNSNQFTTDNFKPIIHPDNRPIYAQVINKDQVICAGQWGVIYIFNRKTGNFKAYQSNFYKNTRTNLGLTSANYPNFKQLYGGLTHNGDTYLLTDSSIIAFNENTRHFAPITKELRPYRAMIPDVDNLNYWVGSDLGLEYFIKAKNRLFLIENNKDKSPLENKSILSLCQFNQNHLLIGTDQGLLLYDHQKKLFSPLPNSLESSPLKSMAVKKIKPFENQLVFILNQGFVICDLSFKEVKNYNLSNSFKQGLLTNQLFDIEKINDLYYLASDRGLITFNGNNLFKTTEELKAYTIYDIERKGDDLLMATSDGYMEYSTASHMLVKFNEPTKQMISSHLISFVKPDKEGRLWVGTTNRGVNKIGSNQKLVSHYFAENNSGYQGNNALCFLESSDGEIFIGGEKLNLYQPGSDSFTQPEFADLLPNEPVLNLLEDNTKQLWIITENHISIINASRQQADIHKQNKLTFTGAALKLKNGKFCIGTEQGFLYFLPDEINFNPYNIPVTLTSIEVMGHEVAFPLEPNKKLSLKYNDNFVTIQFSALQYNTDKINYEYKLKGVDKNWISTTKNYAAYTKLAPGRYRFQVRNKKNPNESMSEIIIRIRPPFWKSTWFYLAILLGVILILWIWINQRLKKIHILESNLKLKQRLLLSQLNPHFIFNALMAIQSFIYKNKPHVAGNYLSKFAKLMRLFLTNMRHELTSIEQEIQTLKFYLEMQQLRFNEAFDFSITTEGINDAHKLALPTMMIQPVIENAVEHGIYHKTSNGIIEINFNLEKDILIVTVKDNGKGYLHTIKNKSTTHKSVSTSIIRDRIKSFNKKSKHLYSIIIKDLSEDDKQLEGTVVTMRLPATYINNKDEY